MLVLDAERIRALAPMGRLVECLRDAFRTTCSVPPRQILRVPGGKGDRVFIPMSVFDEAGRAVVKLVTVFPDNQGRGLETVQAAIVAFSETGTPVALLDGTVVTHLRTGAASALASQYLSRPSSTHLVVMGTGALAPTMAMAHCAVRPINRISIWGRRPERAEETAAEVQSMVGGHVAVGVPTAIDQAVAAADIVCCCTSSSNPILAGRWLKCGTFVDLVGSFTPTAREADDDVVTQARIFVDTFDGALAEGGDLVDPLNRNIIDRQRIEGELADLVSGRAAGRLDGNEITVFKSVGTAIEDLAAAQMIIQAAKAKS